MSNTSLNITFKKECSGQAKSSEFCHDLELDPTTTVPSIFPCPDTLLRYYTTEDSPISIHTRNCIATDAGRNFVSFSEVIPILNGSGTLGHCPIGSVSYFWDGARPPSCGGTFNNSVTFHGKDITAQGTGMLHVSYRAMYRSIRIKTDSIAPAIVTICQNGQSSTYTFTPQKCMGGSGSKCCGQIEEMISQLQKDLFLNSGSISSSERAEKQHQLNELQKGIYIDPVVVSPGHTIIVTGHGGCYPYYWMITEPLVGVTLTRMDGSIKPTDSPWYLDKSDPVCKLIVAPNAQGTSRIVLFDICRLQGITDIDLTSNHRVNCSDANIEISAYPSNIDRGKTYPVSCEHAAPPCTWGFAGTDGKYLEWENKITTTPFNNLIVPPNIPAIASLSVITLTVQDSCSHGDSVFTTLSGT